MARTIVADGGQLIDGESLWEVPLWRMPENQVHQLNPTPRHEFTEMDQGHSHSNIYRLAHPSEVCAHCVG